MVESAQELYEKLTDEQKHQVQSLKTPEEMLEYAHEQGMELTDDQLEGITGGWDGCFLHGCWADRSIS